MNGLKKAILYSLKPHELGYCGPLCVKDSKNTLRRYLLGEKFTKNKIINLLDGFIGAKSYYKLIAGKNNIKDIYDEQVVEAYWVGNELLKKITVQDLKKMILSEFVKPKFLTKKKAEEIIEKIPKEVVAHHSFHVFFVSSISGRVKIVKKRKDDCKSSCGQVIQIYEKDQKVKIKTNKLFPNKKDVIIKIDWNMQFVPNIKKGDFVSFHWGRISEKLTKTKYNNLIRYTNKNYIAYKKAYGEK
jgi:hypothetical protein